MKKIIWPAFLTILSLPIFVQAQATISINPNIPGVNAVSTSGPCGWIVNFYTFALVIAGILAFGAIVFGGIKYATSAGNASSQAEGRSWIWNALLGLLLLAGAYLILYTINPNLTKCTLPSLSSVAAAPGGGTTGGGTSGGGRGGNTPPANGTPIPNSQACQALSSAGVSASCSILNGIQQSTVDALTDLTKECPGASVAVTSVTGGSHSTRGGCTHSNGYKADISSNSSIDSCVTGSNNGFTSAGTRGDGAALYAGPDGAIFADERTKPSNCGNPCSWTGPHWDIQSCNVP